ncbi:hypothetical protein [Streptomyces sp. NPDC004675]|uniref:hypothetical protein n=1 Tax=Streptomyces sp. NPDC004675 TaxID=3154286 RepID=UPI0033B15F00
MPGLLADDGALRGLELADGRTLQAAGVFLLSRRIPNGGVLEGLCCERDKQGFLRTGPAGRISRPGLRAIGNVVDPRAA